MDWDGCDDAVAFRIDHGDCAGLGVDDVDLVANRVGGEIGGVDANLQGPVLAEVDEVEYGDGVGAAVADVGVLPVAVGNVRETAPRQPEMPRRSRADSGGNGSREERVGGVLALFGVYRGGERTGKGKVRPQRIWRIPAKLFGG